MSPDLQLQLQLVILEKFNVCISFFFSLRSNLKFSIDKSSAEEIEITVDDVTVLITDYKLLPKKIEVQTPDDNEINPKTVQIAEIEPISPKEE